MRFNPLPVASTGDIADPFFIIQVPFHGFANSCLECFPGTPAKVALNLTCIHGITTIVARAILNKRNQTAAGCSAAAGNPGLAVLTSGKSV